MIQRKKISRYSLISVIVVVLIVAIFARLFNLQIVNGVMYSQQSEKRLLKSTPVTASRGEITDRYGRPLVTNRMGFNIVFYKEYIEKENLNKLIADTIEILEAYSQTYYDTLPINENGDFEFKSPQYNSLDEKENEKHKHRKKYIF